MKRANWALVILLLAFVIAIFFVRRKQNNAGGLQPILEVIPACYVVSKTDTVFYECEIRNDSLYIDFSELIEAGFQPGDTLTFYGINWAHWFDIPLKRASFKPDTLANEKQ